MAIRTSFSQRVAQSDLTLPDSFAARSASILDSLTAPEPTQPRHPQPVLDSTGIGVMALVEGDGNDNTLSGTNGDDTIYGYGGDDYIDGGNGGYDVLYGGAGDGSLVGGYGGDLVFGGADADEIIGYGGSTLHGDGGDDEIVIWGNLATLYGGNGSDTLTVSALGDQTLFGGSGNDTLTGNGYDQTFYGGAGADTSDGDGGDDTFGYLAADTGEADSVFGGADDDKILLSAAGVFDLRDLQIGSIEGIEFLPMVAAWQRPCRSAGASLMPAPNSRPTC